MAYLLQLFFSFDPDQVGNIGWTNETTLIKLLMNPWLQIEFLHKVGLDSGMADLGAVKAAIKRGQWFLDDFEFVKRAKA
jgi:hypothetical protein